MARKDNNAKLESILQVISKHDVYGTLYGGKERMIELKGIIDAPIELGSYRCCWIKLEGNERTCTYKSYRVMSLPSETDLSLVRKIYDILLRPKTRLDTLRMLNKILRRRFNVLVPLSILNDVHQECQLSNLAKGSCGNMISDYVSSALCRCEVCEKLIYFK